MANEQKTKGFAGLDSLVTEVPASPPRPLPPEKHNPVPEPITAPPRQVYTGTPTTGSKPGGNVGWWLVGMVLLAVIVYVSNSGNSPPSSSSYQATSPAVQSTPVSEPAYASNETAPPVGEGLSFDRSEIRYCLSQDIRIAAWQGQVNQYSQSAVDAFNVAVGDCNARCAHYRYRDGELESVRSQVEANRAELVQEGISQAVSNR